MTPKTSTPVDKTAAKEAIKKAPGSSA